MISKFKVIRRGLGRWAGVLGLAALIGALGTALASSSETPGKSSSSPKSAPSQTDAAKVFSEEHPLLLLEGLHCQVHREGEIRQTITAQTGRYDEVAKIMDLNAMSVNFKDQGTTLGLVTCGGARVWMLDDPLQQVGMHDMLLNQTVRLRSNDNWVLETPEMHYHARDSLLISDKGYLKQFPMQAGFLVGQGTGIEIKLLLDKKTFEYCREFGQPAEYRKSDKPVLKP